MTELTVNVQKVFDLVKDFKPTDLNQLVKALEEEYGVSAAAAVVVAGWTWADVDAAQSDTVSVELTEAGQQKIAVIKVIKELLGIDLKAAKDLVEKAPVLVKEKIKFEDAEVIKAKLVEVGATVNFK